MSDVDNCSLREARVEDLLIAVATPGPFIDSPERKAAWDEIKRRCQDTAPCLTNTPGGLNPDGGDGVGNEPDAGGRMTSGSAPRTTQTERELRLRTIEAVCDLMHSSGSFDVDADAIVPHSNGYGMWFVAYDPQPISTARIPTEEILRRIEAREALKEANRGKR